MRGKLGRNRGLWGVWITLWWLLGAGLALADSYEAVVPVADRTAATRTAAVEQALGEVLGRITGERPAGGAAAADLLPRAESFVQHYRYEGSPESGLRLRVGFDGAALSAALRSAGVALWGQERPPLLLWLAADDGSRRYLLGSDPTDPLYQALQAAAQTHGLEVILPLLDLEDQGRVSYSDVWGGFQERVVTASARYQTPQILIARVQRLGTAAWSSRWTLRQAGQAEPPWQAGGADLPALFDDAMAQTAQRLAAQLRAPAMGMGSAALPVVIEGVMELDAYAAVQAYLQGLAPVRSLQLVGLQNDRLLYQIDVQGGVAALDQALRMRGLLYRIEGPPAAPGSTPPVYYRLQR